MENTENAKIQDCENQDYKNIEIKEHGCFFTEYANQMRPIFYMKLASVSNLFDFQNIEKHKIFDQMQKEEDSDNMYILKIEDMGLPFIPVQKDVVQQMIYEGELLENLNIEKFVEKYGKRYNYITNENLNKLLPLLHHELKKVEIELQQHKIQQQIKDTNFNLDDVSDISDINSDSD
jgi:hypothetical protein